MLVVIRVPGPICVKSLYSKEIWISVKFIGITKSTSTPTGRHLQQRQLEFVDSGFHGLILESFPSMARSLLALAALVP